MFDDEPTGSGLDEQTGSGASEADKQPTTSMPSDPTGSGVDEPVTSSPDEPTGSEPDEPVTSPEESTGSEPNEPDGQGLLLGSFRTLQHQVRGDVYAIDEKTIRIENFRYDGTGVSKLAFLFYDHIAMNISIDEYTFSSELHA